MEKTAKITRTTFKNVWDNPKGGQIFYHNIELDNGDKGSIGSREKMPSKLNPGSDLTYTIEGDKIKAVIAQTGGGAPWTKGGKQGPEPRVQMISFAMAYTKDLIVGGKLEIKDLESGFERMYTIMTGKL